VPGKSLTARKAACQWHLIHQRPGMEPSPAIGQGIAPNGSFDILASAAPCPDLPVAESGTGPSMQTLEYWSRHSLCALTFSP
jgi:hypothetical protein